MSPLEPPLTPPLSMSPPHSTTGFKSDQTSHYARNVTLSNPNTNPPRQSSYATLRTDHLHPPLVPSPALSNSSFSSSSSSTGKQKWKLVKNIFTIVRPDESRRIQRRNSTSSTAPSTAYSQSSSNNSSSFSNGRSQLAKPAEVAKRPRMKVFRKDTAPVPISGRPRPEIVHPTLKQRPTHRLQKSQSQPDLRSASEAAKNRDEDELYTHFPLPFKKPTAMLTTIPKIDRKSGEFPGDIHIHIPLPRTRWNFGLDDDSEDDMLEVEPPKKTHGRNRSMTAPSQATVPSEHIVFGGDQLYAEPEELDAPIPTPVQPVSPPRPRFATQQSRQYTKPAAPLMVVPRHQRQRSNSTPIVPSELVEDGAPLSLAAAVERLRGPSKADPKVRPAQPTQQPLAPSPLPPSPTLPTLSPRSPSSTSSPQRSPNRHRSQTLPSQNDDKLPTSDAAPLPLSVAVRKLQSRSLRKTKEKQSDSTSDSERMSRRRSQSLNQIPPDYAAAHVPRMPYSKTGIVPTPSPSPPHPVSPIVIVQKPTLEDEEPYKSIAAALLSPNFEYDAPKQQSIVAKERKMDAGRGQPAASASASERQVDDALATKQTPRSPPTSPPRSKPARNEMLPFNPSSSLRNNQSTRTEERPNIAQGSATPTAPDAQATPTLPEAVPAKGVEDKSSVTISIRQSTKPANQDRHLAALLSPRIADDKHGKAARSDSKVDAILSPKLPTGRSKKKSKLDQLLQELGAAELEFLDEQERAPVSRPARNPLSSSEEAAAPSVSSPAPASTQPASEPTNNTAKQPLPALKVWPSPSSKQCEFEKPRDAYKLQPIQPNSYVTGFEVPKDVHSRPLPPRSPSPKGYKAVPGKHFESYAPDEALPSLAGRRKLSIPSIDPGLLIPPITTSPTRAHHPFDSQMVKATSPLDSLMSRMASSPMYSPAMLEGADNTPPIGSPPPMSGRLQQGSYFPAQGGRQGAPLPQHRQEARPIPAQMQRPMAMPVPVPVSMPIPKPMPMTTPMQHAASPAGQHGRRPDMRLPMPSPQPPFSTAMARPPPPPHSEYTRSNQMRPHRRVEVDAAGRI